MGECVCVIWERERERDSCKRRRHQTSQTASSATEHHVSLELKLTHVSSQHGSCTPPSPSPPQPIVSHSVSQPYDLTDELKDRPLITAARPPAASPPASPPAANTS